MVFPLDNFHILRLRQRLVKYPDTQSHTYLLFDPNLVKLQSMEVGTLYYCLREEGQTDTVQHMKYRSNIDLRWDKLYIRPLCIVEWYLDNSYTS
jgi:hypothetical protein